MSSSILVTGSNSGIGRLSAEALARRGYTVFAGMRETQGKNAQAARELNAWAQAGSFKLQVLDLDVSSDKSVDAAFINIYSSVEVLDVVMNNAAVLASGPIEAFTPEQLEEIFNINVLGAQRVNRAALPRMRKRGSGLLMHISSTLGRTVLPGGGPYCASKFALEALAESYRYELSPLGIDSVIIEPGAYPTGFTAKALRPEDSHRVKDYGARGSLMGRVFTDRERLLRRNSEADPRDVAETIIGLIEMPLGGRPLRVVVDHHEEAVGLMNENSAQVQEHMLRKLGLSELIQVSSS